MLNYKQYEIKLQQSLLIKNIKVDGVQVNLFELSNVDTPLVNIYIKKDEKIYTLLNNENNIEAKIYENALQYNGNVAGIDFCVMFKLAENNTVFIDVKLSELATIYFSSDIGLGDEGIGEKSTYSSQYIDNKVFPDNTVSMRRTSKTSTGYPFGQFGSLNNINSYVTEGYDFLGLSFKENQKIEGLNEKKLKSRPRNYEMAFVAFEVANTSEACFYMNINKNLETAIDQKVDEGKIKEGYDNFELGKVIKQNKVVYQAIEFINGEKLVKDELDNLYPKKVTEEHIDGQLGAFFTKEHAHVVLPNKELVTERTHANIITTGNHSIINDNTFISTNYMNGVFSAQNAVGNTQLNQFNKNVLSSLYVNKLEGMRFILLQNGKYKMLNIPSIYEMGFNYSKWVYKLPNNNIEIISYTNTKEALVSIEYKSEKPCEILIVDQIMPVFERNGNTFKIKNDTFQYSKLPNLKYTYHLENGTFLENSLDENIVEFYFKNKTSGKITIVGSKEGNLEVNISNFLEAKKDYEKYYESLLKGLKLEISGKEKVNIESFNHLIYWYLHNSLIHFATPHGIEQHGGAAWGTRDVCQGPVELFLTLDQFSKVREILLKVFDNQFIEDGNWPQWFMFDEYENIRPYESHGDIIVWPLKALSDYLLKTGDMSILEEKVGYYSYKQKRSTVKESVLDHVLKEINYIKEHFLENTYISCYGEGDWDDTLQPANSDLRENMASGWTVPLTYQALSNFSKAIANYKEDLANDLGNLADNIKKDYQKIMIKDGVATGFIYKNNDSYDYLLHPLDTKTGIKYRLLPINRSIISGIFTKEQMENHLKIIDEKLKCPDGVRLMDAPAKYAGGVSEIFQRAETASTVGREISLQYVHAHIRYIEAMTKIGDGERAYEGLKVVSPFNIHKNVANANIRQSNAYYSSSEGDFNNRYEYAKNFDLLKSGNILVKSGWRIYSSGPGIYLNQFISNFLGFKVIENELYIDSVVPKNLEGLKVHKKIDNKNITFVYKQNCENKINDKIIQTQKIKDTYKTSGFKLDVETLQEGDIITIEI